MKVGCRISRVLQMNEIQPPEGYPPLGSCMFTHSSNCLVLAQESLVLGRGLYSLPYSRKMHSTHTSSGITASSSMCSLKAAVAGVQHVGGLCTRASTAP